MYESSILLLWLGKWITNWILRAGFIKVIAHVLRQIVNVKNPHCIYGENCQSHLIVTISLWSTSSLWWCDRCLRFCRCKCLLSQIGFWRTDWSELLLTFSPTQKRDPLKSATFQNPNLSSLAKINDMVFIHGIILPESHHHHHHIIIVLIKMAGWRDSKWRMPGDGGRAHNSQGNGKDCHRCHRCYHDLCNPYLSYNSAHNSLRNGKDCHRCYLHQSSCPHLHILHSNEVLSGTNLSLFLVVESAFLLQI